jgi:amino acid adenylation domain-containing protein
MNPEYPAERLSYMLTDTNAGIVLTNDEFAPRIRDIASPSTQVISLDEASVEIGREATGNLNCETVLGDLAFIFYTSGSTGMPKAVMWVAADRLPTTKWEAETFQLREGERYLFRAPIGFTLVLAEILMALLNGGELIIVPTKLGHDAAHLARLIAEHQVPVVTVVPTLLQALTEQPDFAKCVSLREVSTIGEPMTEALKRRFFESSQARLSVMYGATEAAIATLFRPDRNSADRSVCIGSPLPKRSIYLLDERFEHVSPGESGEICLGGRLARGYWNRPDVTAEKFIPDPFSSVPGERLYRTGDLGRYLPDGTIEFVGRVDDQIKVRGFRIEPAEIEKAICEHPAISRAAVVLKEGEARDPKLIAYFTPTGSTPPSSGALRQFLKGKLPAHMIPVRFVTLAEIPLTPTGKLNRRALPEPESTRPELETSYAPPSSPIELTLARIWADVLGINRVGLHDNFFDLGGDSLAATRVIARALDAFQLELPVKALFESPTVADMAKVILNRQVKEAGQEELGRMLDELEGMSEDEARQRVAQERTLES